MTCMMGNDWSAVFGKMWKHHRSLIRLLRQMEWEVWKSLLFCKWQRGPQHLHQSPKQYMKSYAGKRRTIFISKFRQGAYIDKLISLLSGWFFFRFQILQTTFQPQSCLAKFRGAISRCSRHFIFIKKNAKSSFKTSFSLLEKGWLFNISKSCDKSGESGPGK